MKRADPRRALPSVDAIVRAGAPTEVERARFTRLAREVLARRCHLGHRDVKTSLQLQELPAQC